MARDIGKGNSSMVICFCNLSMTTEWMLRFKPIHESRACYSYSENPVKVSPRAYIPLNMKINHEERDITFFLKCKDVPFALL